MADLYPSPAKPLSVARALNRDVFTEDQCATLKFWRGAWYRFSGKSWRRVTELTVKGPIWERLEQVVYEGEKGIADYSPTPAKVANVLEPLQILNGLDDELEPPLWLAGERGNPRDLIVLNNGILNYRTGEFTEDHDARLFTLWHLPFDYDPEAECPTWNRFLAETFAHDQAAARTLQQWFGYCISGRTDLQKALLLIGPPRSGKGTISRVLQQLVGMENAVSPSLGSLGGEFGAQGLIGKQLAVIEDARDDRNRNAATTVERLLGIIGEDKLTINRKNLPFWDGQLPTRIMLVSNEVPRFGDSSGALVRRFIAIELKRSHADNPDTALGRKLAAELPGILRWALEGLHDLEVAGNFTTPDTMAGVSEMLSDLSQPVAVFLDDHEGYEVTGSPEDCVLLRALHASYKGWCEQVGIGALKQTSFAQALKATDPRIELKNTAVGGQRKARRIFGVKEVNTSNVWQLSGQTA